MKREMGKIFVKYLSGGKDIVTIPYNPSIETDYYAFIKRNYENETIQFILTSEIMVKLLEHYFLDRKCIISNIEFMEDDEALRSRIDEILNLLKDDRGYFSELISEIDFLSYDSSIDIKRMEFKCKRAEAGKSSRIMFQVNGIFEIDADNYESESKNIELFLRSLYDR